MIGETPTVEYIFPSLVLALTGGLITGYAFHTLWRGRIVAVAVERLRGTPFLGRYPREAFYWAAGALARALARAPVMPDTLTVLSLALTAFTLPLAAMGRFEAAGFMLLFGSLFDALDGLVARELDAACEAGEMLDSVVDRYADTLCLIGLGLFYRDSAWRLGIVFLALMGSGMVSYVRAKAEKFQLSLPPTIMRRAERVVYLAGALLLGPVVSTWLAPASVDRPATLAVVAVVAALSNVAAIQLLLGARAALRHARRPA